MLKYVSVTFGSGMYEENTHTRTRTHAHTHAHAHAHTRTHAHTHTHKPDLGYQIRPACATRYALSG